MKNLVIVLFAFLVGTNVSMASSKKLTVSPESVIKAYISAFLNSDAEIVKEILSDEAFVTMPRQNQIIKHTKRELVQFYKKEGKNKLNCNASHEIVSSCDAAVIATIDFQFENFTQRNYITIERNQNNEWKVMSVNKFFV